MQYICNLFKKLEYHTHFISASLIYFVTINQITQAALCNQYNGLETIVSQALKKKKEEQGESFRIETVNISLIWLTADTTRKAVLLLCLPATATWN